MLWIINGQLEANAFYRFNVPMNKKICVFYDTLSNVGEYGYNYETGKTSHTFTKLAPDCITDMFNRNKEGVFRGKIYDIRIYDKYNLIKKFIPCCTTTIVTDVNGKQCSAGTAGLYDTVEGKFYTNQGSGTFGYETEDGTYVEPTNN